MNKAAPLELVEALSVTSRYSVLTKPVQPRALVGLLRELLADAGACETMQ